MVYVKKAINGHRDSIDDFQRKICCHTFGAAKSFSMQCYQRYQSDYSCYNTIWVDAFDITIMRQFSLAVDIFNHCVRAADIDADLSMTIIIRTNYPFIQDTATIIYIIELFALLLSILDESVNLNIYCVLIIVVVVNQIVIIIIIIAIVMIQKIILH